MLRTLCRWPRHAVAENNRWRAYVRDPRAPSPRTLDTALLLCEGHGLLLAPPHVEEFLSGERRALLGGLDPDRSGCVCEILTPEEWDALTLVRDRITRWVGGGVVFAHGSCGLES